MKFQIKARWSSRVVYECELDTSFETEPRSLQLGEAIKKALESGSNLSGSDLRGSNLSGSDLRGSNLSGSDLSGSNLTQIRDDLWAVLSAAPREVAALRAALIAGLVDGSTYSGECSCLVGTIAAARKVSIDELGNLKPNSLRPIERFFMSIRKGDTPETNSASKIVLDWIDEWMSNMQAAFGMQQ